MNQENNGNILTADLAYGQDAASSQGSESTRGDQSSAINSGANRESQEATALFPDDEAKGYQTRWQDIQAKFVDEPKDCVEEADSLVAEVVQQLATRFAEQRSQLEEQWSKGSEVSTEDLRQALRHYRSFFERLLAA